MCIHCSFLHRSEVYLESDRKKRSMNLVSKVNIHESNVCEDESDQENRKRYIAARMVSGNLLRNHKDIKSPCKHRSVEVQVTRETVPKPTKKKPQCQQESTDHGSAASQ